jgi:hypothetical protein
MVAFPPLSPLVPRRRHADAVKECVRPAACGDIVDLTPRHRRLFYLLGSDIDTLFDGLCLEPTRAAASPPPGTLPNQISPALSAAGRVGHGSVPVKIEDAPIKHGSAIDKVEEDSLQCPLKVAQPSAKTSPTVKAPISNKLEGDAPPTYSKRALLSNRRPVPDTVKVRSAVKTLADPPPARHADLAAAYALCDAAERNEARGSKRTRARPDDFHVEDHVHRLEKRPRVVASDDNSEPEADAGYGPDADDYASDSDANESGPDSGLDTRSVTPRGGRRRGACGVAARRTSTMTRTRGCDT